MSRPSASPLVERVDTETAHRYEILVDGKRAGLTEYRDRGAQRVFYHTEVDAAFAGQGLAAQLVHGALVDVRAPGKRIVPVCPYVAMFPRCPAVAHGGTGLTRSGRSSNNHSPSGR
ncbi:GNAT family N-acetyltransferase [Streptomyces canus]|uniref:GNAT family N-acetyltransferase n=1 Tax=Streptomyces canus TaxID=58343 RepID=UPI0037108DA3